jgi:nucleoside-diphosphate-sugar epimerase
MESRPASLPRDATQSVSVEEEPPLTVAVTGATGTVGPALLSRLLGEPSVACVRVLGRREPPLPHAGARVQWHAVDVRDRAAVARGVAGADVVIHLAFALYGIGSRDRDLFVTNVEGSLNVARAAEVAGARRFVFTSSAAVYGFHRDNPPAIDEEFPMRASGRHFYGRHKAQAEVLIRAQLRATATELFILRPCGIIGPNAAGAAANVVPRAARPILHASLTATARTGLRPMLPVPPVSLQVVHEADVAQALVLAALGRGPASVYNLAGEGAVDAEEALELLGLRRAPVPRELVGRAFAAAAALPPLLPAVGWAETGTASLILDTTRARRELRWAPRYDTRGALRATRATIGW